VVLAGGRAARLGGADKPALVIGGRSLLDVVAGAAVAAGAGELIIVGPRRPGLIRMPADSGPGGGIPVRWVSEDPPGSGPVPALRCGLAAVTGGATVGTGEPAGPLVLVLAADLPFLRPGPLTALAGAVRRGAAAGAVLEDDGGRPQWLVSCWDYGPLRAGLDHYGGHTLRGLFGALRPVRLGWPRDDGEPPPWLDCDTPEAVDQARAWASR
jgi:molybdopterin-guanine dinucleotide biosynthesis protein A